ncbi:MAG TPA: methyltransferase domain-containing protein [Kofleriaceae bacterium]|nr:methyltransferase domain-containing protein [Kofleriaceae bacterium]
MRTSLIDRTAYRAQQLSFLTGSTLLQETARALSRRRRPPLSADTLTRLRRRYFRLLQRDLDNVASGMYPRELLFNLPIASYMRSLPSLIRDAPRVVRRMRSKNYKDLPAHVDLDRERYPAYYRRTFHWQTDGYFSKRSAAMYDVGVELLFGGTADVMRRQIIPPITRFLAGRDPREVKLLDIACGTGRPLNQLAVAHPDVRYHGVDLSPYYVRLARERLARVREMTLMAENGESLPFVDQHFDVVTSVYLFHELPRNARRRVLADAYRVLRPGGLLVLQDSAQPFDSGELEDALHNFPRDFHEPFYDDYLRDDLAAAATESGFEVESVEAHLVAKVVVARKPAH